MKKKAKRNLIFLSVLLLLFTLFACGGPGKTEEKKDGGKDKAGIQSIKTADKFSGSLDLSVINNNGYSAESVIPAGGKTILISASKKPDTQNGNEPHEIKMRLYAANIETGNVWDKYIEVGFVEANGTHRLCDDGTAAVIELAGNKKNIVFVNPRTMTANRVSIPHDEVWDVAVAPNKKRIAFTKYDGTYISDMGFGKIELVLPRKAVNPKDNMTDELSRAFAFTPDSSQLIYHHVGYEVSLGYGLFNIVTRANRYLEFPDMSAGLFSANKLFLSNVYENAPAGYIDITDKSGKLNKINGLPKDAVQYIDTNSGSELIGFIRLKEDSTVAKIYDSNGKLVSETTIKNPNASAIRVIENEKAAVITAQANTGILPQVYVWRY